MDENEGNCSKIFLLIFNILFWLSSFIIFLLGTYYLLQNERSSLFVLFTMPVHNLTLFQLLAWILVFLAIMTFLMALCGFFAIIENNRCLLFTYILLLIFIFVMELTIGMLVVVFQERIFSQKSTINLISRLKNEYGIESSFTAAIDLAQVKFGCCGIKSPQDYEQSSWYQKQLLLNTPEQNMLRVSRTCCKLANQMEVNSHLNPRPENEILCQSNLKQENLSFRNQKGCLQLVEKFIRSECKMFTILGLGLAGFSLMGIVAGICFCCSVRSRSRKNGVI